MHETQVEKAGKAIAHAIKIKREKVGLSKNALAQKAGISVQSVSFIEDAVNSPSISTYLRICSALEVRPDVLLGEALTEHESM